jgi:hypothetical protein
VLTKSSTAGSFPLAARSERRYARAVTPLPLRTRLTITAWPAWTSEASGRAEPASATAIARSGAASAGDVYSSRMLPARSCAELEPLSARPGPCCPLVDVVASSWALK